jgi:hypothetical protein
MRRAHRRVLATAFIAALAVPTGASAQVCMGIPIPARSFGIFGEYSTTEGADGIGANVTANVNGPLSVQIGYTLSMFDDSDENLNTFYGNLAYELPNMSFSLCPMAGAARSKASEEAFGVELEASVLLIPIGIGIGREFTRGPVNISVFAIPQFLHFRTEVSADGIIDSQSDSRNEFGAQLGARVRSGNLWGGAGFAFNTIEESDLVFSIGVGVAIGGSR